MLGLNPFHEWWKISSYTKRYHYFWLMPLIAVFLGLAWGVLKIVDSVSFKK
ncbi:TPA: hypothetical protein ACORDH_005358 [Bacillus cereus]